MDQDGLRCVLYGSAEQVKGAVRYRCRLAAPIFGSYLSSVWMVWDEPKRDRNRQPPPAGHGLDFADARDRFVWETALIAPSHSGRHGDARFTAIGYLDERLVTLVFSPLGTEAISAISLRTASNRERKAYAARQE